MNVLCSAEPCPIILNATCVHYEGGNLVYTGINTNDSLQTALEKIDGAIGDIVSSGLYVPLTRTLTINGITQDLSINRTWTVSTLPPQAGNAGYFLTTDGTNASWIAITPGGVSGVLATAPLVATGGAVRTISTSMASGKLIGRGTAGTGVFEEITLGTGLSLSGTTLNATAVVTPAALSKTDDTNVTLTLTGSPNTALLQAVGLTLGWTGTLAVARGGTGLSTLGTSGQFLRVNSGGTALEYYTLTGTGISDLNGLTAAIQTFAVGTSGTDFNISSVTPTHTFNLPTASGTNRGALSSSDWTNFNTAYTNRITSLTTTGSSGAATLSSNTLNIPNYTLSGLGGQTQLNGTGYVKMSGTTVSYVSSIPNTDLANSSITIQGTSTALGGSVDIINGTGFVKASGTTISYDASTYLTTAITSLNSLTDGIQTFATPGTSGTAPAWTSASGIHTLNIPLASAASVTAGLISKTEYDTFNNKQNAITLTTTGTSGASTFSSGTLNIPQYQGQLTLTTTGTSGAATLSGNTLNIPQYTGSGYRTLVTLGSDQTRNANTLADITGMSFSATGGVTYRIYAVLAWTQDNNTGGWRFSVSGSVGSPTLVSGRVITNTSATTQAGNYFSAYDGGTAVATTNALFGIAVLEAIVTPSANETITLRFCRNAAGTITIKAGSTLEYW